MDADTARLSDPPQNLSRQPTAFRAKHKGIAGGIVDQVIPLSAFGGDGKQPAIREALHAIRPTLVDRDRGKFMIVQSRSHQLLILQRKAQRLYQVQPGSSIGAEPDDVAGVRGDFRLIENDIEHEGAV